MAQGRRRQLGGVDRSRAARSELNVIGSLVAIAAAAVSITIGERGSAMRSR